MGLAVVGYGSVWLGGCWDWWKHNLELPKAPKKEKSCSLDSRKEKEVVLHEGKKSWGCSSQMFSLGDVGLQSDG